MTNLLKISTLSLAVLGTAFGACRAEGIHISVQGKTPLALHREIVRAAHRVCDEAALDAIDRTYNDVCIAATVEKADEQLRQSMKILTAQYSVPQSGR